MSDAIDRSLSEDPRTVIVSGADVYHATTGADPPVADCGWAPREGEFIRLEESDAIDAGATRCESCGFTDELSLYIRASKVYHALREPAEAVPDAADDSGPGPANAAAVCGEAPMGASRRDAVLRSSACLEHNGIEPCGDCFGGGEP